MSDIDDLLERNRRFGDSFAQGDLPIRPRLSARILTCLDARLDPAHVFGLELGDAFVMRNAGGRVTPGVVSDLAVLGFLGGLAPGGAAMEPELVIVQHTDCGMMRLADPAAQGVLAERLGIEADEVAQMAITDPADSVREDIGRLRESQGVPGSLVVSGLVYDVTTGTVEQVVAPGPLRDK